MRRKLLMVLLGAGAIAGFASGFARLSHRHHFGHGDVERRVAETCADAALRADKSARPGGPR